MGGLLTWEAWDIFWDLIGVVRKQVERKNHLAECILLFARDVLIQCIGCW